MVIYLMLQCYAMLSPRTADMHYVVREKWVDIFRNIQ